jgi:hypothetical protein
MADPNSPLFRFQLWRAGLPPALRLILTVNLGVFAVAAVAAILAAFGLGGPARLLEWLALPGEPGALVRRLWSPLTYGFTNLVGGGGIWAIIGFAFAMYWLNWLGREIEETYGGYRLFGLYLMSALFGAAVALALAVLPIPFPLRDLYFGAWGPVTAVLVAVATLHPTRGVGLFLLGIVQMKWIAIVFVALSLFAPDATLLGAALFGYLFAKALQADIDLSAWLRPFFERRPAPRPEKATSRSGSARAVSADPAPVRTLGRRAAVATAPTVDEILDKILDKGVDSLTPEERRILDDAGRNA